MDLGNILLVAALTLARSLLLAQGFFVIEHPRPRAGFPSIFWLDEVQQLLEDSAVQLTVFDQCRFGQFAVKGTGLLSNLPEIPRVFGGCFCNHPQGQHVSLQGVDSSGRFLTSYAQEYPAGMCESLADCLIERLETRPPVAARKVRAPAVDDFWTRSSDWHLLFRSDWQRQEHQHVLELRTLVNLGRHLARSRRSWGRTYLAVTDSLVCLGALAKGRSSSPPLLRLLRRWASIRFGLGISYALRWVPSGRNLADGPSRRAKLGDHPADDAPPTAPVVVAYRGQGRPRFRAPVAVQPMPGPTG